MRNLIKAEWFKLSKSFGFRVLFLCNLASLCSSVFLLMAGADATGHKMLLLAITYTFHHAIIGYLFSAFFICNEFSDRTFGMSLLSGYSRRRIFISKSFVFLCGLSLLYLTYIMITTIVITIGNGYGMEFNAEFFGMLLCGMIGCITMGAVMLLVSMVMKKAVATIGVGIGIIYLLSSLESNFKEKLLPVLKYTYTYQIGQLALWGDGFSPIMYLGVMIITSLLAFVAAGIIFEKAELK
ncbi:MAG: ABC transporter permease [Clostridium sp.]|nr:ABC transporter permease [Clostridium sp.]